MKVSVIIPAYNCGKYLAECIGSVRSQTYRNWECIVVNDASTDDTREILERIVGKDDRFLVIHMRINGGLSRARNLGISASKGKAIFFLDADDWISPDALEYLVRQSRLHPDVGRIVAPCMSHWRVGVGRWEIQPTGIHTSDSPYLFKDYTCDVGHSTGSLYVKANIRGELRFPVVPKYEDMVFNAGLIFSGITTLITDNYLYHYRRRQGSIVDQPFPQEEADALLAAFEELAERYRPQREVYDRCRNFLDGILNSAGSTRSRMHDLMFED